MEAKSKSDRRRHDPVFKERAVAMAAESGNIAETARQLGIGYSLLNSWRNAADLARSKGQGLAMALEEKARLAALERENALLREENEILKKATAYFARDRVPPRSTPGSKA
jgi:transposase